MCSDLRGVGMSSYIDSPAGAGPTGPQGNNAYTSTTANFEQPEVGDSVTILVFGSAWVIAGQAIAIDNAGTYLVVSVPSSTSIEVRNLGYDGNVTPGSIISFPAAIGPIGLRGATGPQGPAGATGATGATGPAGPQDRIWGASTSGTNAAVRYLHPEYSDSAVSTTIIEYEFTHAVTLSLMRVRANGAGTGTGNLVYTLYKNGSPTALSATVAATAVSGQDLANSVAFVAGDRVALAVHATGTVSGAHTRPLITVQSL